MIKRILAFMTICLFSVSSFSVEHSWDDLEGAETLRQTQALKDTPLFQAVLNQDTPTFKEELGKLDFNELRRTIQAQTISGDTLIDTMAKVSERNLLKIVRAQTISGDTLINTIYTMRKNPELIPNQLTLQMQLLVKRLLKLGLENRRSIISLFYDYIDYPRNHTFWSIIRDESTPPPLSSLFYAPTKELLDRFFMWGFIQRYQFQVMLTALPAITVIMTSIMIINSIMTGNPDIGEGGKLLLSTGATAATLSTGFLGNWTGRKLSVIFCNKMFVKKL